MKLKDLCESERPREKLLSKGVSALSDGELLAVLLRNGTGDENVMELSQRLLGHGGGRLDALFSMTADELCSLQGIGPAKAASVLAASELGRRFMLERAESPRLPVVSARTVYDMMIPRLKGLDHEECWMMFLDASCHVCGTVRMTAGGFASTVLDVRQIVREAVRRDAVSVVLVHNHPSGDTRPSTADCAMTEKVRDGLKAVDIRLVDHVIVADHCFFSFAENRVFVT